MAIAPGRWHLCDVGTQLDLFSGRPVPLVRFGGETGVAAVLEPPPSEPEHHAEGPDLPGQMDLFGDRWQRAAAAHRALERFDLDQASSALRQAVANYSTDTTLASRAAGIESLAAALNAALASEASRTAALLAIGDRVPAFLLRAWHLALAESIDAAGGLVDERVASPHWLRGGEPARAEKSIREQLTMRGPRARWIGYLADALAAQGRTDAARAMYRDAFARAPHEVDHNAIVDVEVRNLADVAEVDYEVPGDPVEWMATVGLLEGLFICPGRDADSDTGATVPETAPVGVRFYAWLVRERTARASDERIECRRAMKAIDAAMLKRVLAGRGDAR